MARWISQVSALGFLAGCLIFDVDLQRFGESLRLITADFFRVVPYREVAVDSLAGAHHLEQLHHVPIQSLLVLVLLALGSELLLSHELGVELTWLRLITWSVGLYMLPLSAFVLVEKRHYILPYSLGFGRIL